MKYLSQAVGLSVMMLAGATTAIANTAAPINQHAIAQQTTVKQALTAKDDSKVILKGKIVRSLGNEKYEFQDATGKITVEIDDELWNAKPLNANQAVTLMGEVDIDYKPTKRVEIDVKQITF